MNHDKNPLLVLFFLLLFLLERLKKPTSLLVWECFIYLFIKR